METIGKRLAFIRKQRGYTQASLANSTGVSRGVISNIEYDQNDPLPVVANALCAELHINKEWLLTGKGPIEPSNENARLLEELNQVCSELSEPQLLFLLDTVRSMRKRLEPQPTAEKVSTRSVDDMIAEAKEQERQQGYPDAKNRQIER